MPASRFKIDGFAAVAFVLRILAALFSVAQPSQAFLGIFSDTAALTPDNGAVRFPAADLANGKAHFYAVQSGNKQIRIFAVKTTDGRIRTAFDACDVCFPEKKGYRQEGDFMVCANCGRRFHVSMVGEVHGGCNPAPLASSVEGNDVRIAMADIDAGARFF